MNIEILPQEEHQRRIELAYERTSSGKLKYPGLIMRTHAIDVAKEWMGSGAWGLFLGRIPTHDAGTGRGKSLVLALLFKLLKEKIWRERKGFAHPGKCLYIRCGDLNDLGGYEKAELKEVTQLMKRAGVLILDELGAEDASVLPFVRSVLEHRGSEKRWTAGGGNITGAEMLARFGGRWASRMLEGGRVKSSTGDGDRPRWIVEVDGDDLRGDPRVPPMPPDGEPDGPFVPVERWEALLEEARRAAGRDG